MAEKSATATRETADLPRGIQQAVGEAVMAIGESAREVESGVARTNKAGQALTNILETAEAVKLGAEQSVDVARQAQATANDLVKAVDSERANLKKASTLVLRALDLLGQRIARDAEAAPPSPPRLAAPGGSAERKGLRTPSANRIGRGCT